MVNEKIVKRQLDFCLGVEGWSTCFEVAECETEWCDTPLHGKKKCHSFRVMVTTCNAMFKSIPVYLRK